MKIHVTTIPYPPGLYEDRDDVLHYLIFVGFAHLAPLHPDPKRTQITVFLIHASWHILIRNAGYTGMRVLAPGVEVETAMDRARTVADEIPGAELTLANPEFRPTES